ncbi:hypothetical protein Tco_0315774 [Tanacetum coccineum]
MDQIIKHDFVQETNNHKRKLEDKRNIINNNNNRNNDYHQQQNRRQETSRTYVVTNRLRDVAVYYHFVISTFPVEIVIRYTQIDINYAASGNLSGLGAEKEWETIEDCAQCDK